LEDSHVECIFSYWIPQYIELLAMIKTENAGIYAEYIRRLYAHFVDNSITTMTLLTGFYLEFKDLTTILDPKADISDQTISSMENDFQVLNDSLTTQVRQIERGRTSAFQESISSLSDIIAKEKILMQHCSEPKLVMKKLLRKTTLLSRLIRSLVEIVPPQWHTSLLHLSEDWMAKDETPRQERGDREGLSLPATPSLSVTPPGEGSARSPPLGRSSSIVKPSTLHKEKPPLSSHQTRIATFMARLRGLHGTLEKTYRQWGSFTSHPTTFNDNTRLHLSRQLFVLYSACQHISHDTIFFNDPDIYQCFLQFSALLALGIRSLAAYLHHASRCLHRGLAPLRLMIVQLRFTISKVVTVQYFTPSLFDL